MQRDEIVELAMEYGFTGGFDAEGNLIHDGMFVDAVSDAVNKQQTKILRLLKEACKPYGKAGECVYSTFKHSLEKAKK